MQKPKATADSRFSGCRIYKYMLKAKQFHNIKSFAIVIDMAKRSYGQRSTFNLVMRHQSSVLSCNSLPGICNLCVGVDLYLYKLIASAA